mmetsp:Transcript_17697/g.27875  ORF Transcript_17697/g.27875 Transcript_17697/m.27875 type:complete len:389 (-) Transcript_17697:220-1386(-)
MCQKLCDALCQYKSVRFIQVKNKKLAAIYYTVLLAVLGYVIGFTIIAQKGYQQADEVAGTVGVKIKGSSSVGNDTNFTDITSLIPFDSMDLIRPSMEENAFFLTTAMTITPNQTRGFCDGNPSETPECTVEDASACKEEFYSWNSQGMYTGECGSNNHCQLYTWCPPEDDTDLEVLNNVGKFTVFMKMDVTFDRWNITLSNTKDKNGDGHPVSGYNLLTINEIVSKATDGAIQDISASTLVTEGAIILVSSLWYCDLDYSEEYCESKFDFRRIDGLPDTITSGFNYRTVTYDISKNRRLLEKLHGLRVIFVIEGEGRKFHLVALSTTFGAGLAYLGIATLICDIILERFLPRSRLYAEAKHREVDGGIASRDEVDDEENDESQALNTP